MSDKHTHAAIIGAMLIFGCTATIAADDVGKREFDNNCAVCHGTSGEGDGPFAGIINTKLPDLTRLQEANNGVFPFDRVYQTIDGRKEIAAHGSRDMPIWGSEYNAKAAEYYADYLQQYSAEGYVRGRILALVNHIYALQSQ